MPEKAITWHACGLLAVAILSASCERIAAPACPRGAIPLPRALLLPGPDVFLQYFPAALILHRRAREGEFADRLSDFEASWFVGKLIEHGEPSLAERVSNPNIEAYRVLWIPARGISDFAIRVERGRVQARIDVKRPALCENGREDGLVTASQRYVLGDVAWFELAACMERAFWAAPLRDDIRSEDSVTTVLEGVRGGQHKVVIRSSLSDEEETPERQALARCRALFEAAAGWRQHVPSGP